jgi:hypothetical protein
MPNKWLNQKGITIRKQHYKVANWSDYNASLKRRGDIEVWLSQDVVEHWYFEQRIHDGTGSSKHYTDAAIIVCHEIRQVYKLPLRQTQGFINYTTLSKRLKALNIKSPRYKRNETIDENIAAIAIDSTGLKRFGRDEWHQERHKVDARRSWRKAHFGIDENHIIQAAKLTDRFTADEEVVVDLLAQIDEDVGQYTGDGAYDKASVYNHILAHSPKTDVVIPPAKNSVISSRSHDMRNRNIAEIAANGRMAWQQERCYGQRNYSELGIQRYKRILGRAMHARKMPNQEQEFMIGCGVLNKMTSLGMPDSFRVA